MIVWLAIALILLAGSCMTLVAMRLVEARGLPVAGATDPIRPIRFEEETVAVLPVETALAKLDAMFGLAPVKQEVKGLIARMQLEQKRRDQGLDGSALSQHMVFTGPPGVGKTEIARLIGEIYQGLKVLRKGHV